LPVDLGAAVQALECDQRLRIDLGEDFCNEFIRLKRREWDEYALHVSDWELQRYADGF
jgi:glutamine synthetase